MKIDLKLKTRGKYLEYYWFSFFFEVLETKTYSPILAISAVNPLIVFSDITQFANSALTDLII